VPGFGGEMLTVFKLASGEHAVVTEYQSPDSPPRPEFQLAGAGCVTSSRLLEPTQPPTSPVLGANLHIHCLDRLRLPPGFSSRQTYPCRIYTTILYCLASFATAGDVRSRLLTCPTSCYRGAAVRPAGLEPDPICPQGTTRATALPTSACLCLASRGFTLILIS
jgi:hypothetical protein